MIFKAKNIISISLVLVLLLSVLTACGDNNKKTSTANGATTSQGASNADPSATGANGEIITTAGTVQTITDANGSVITVTTQKNQNGTTAKPTARPTYSNGNNNELILSTVENPVFTSFDSVKPSNITLKASWDCMGTDNNGVIYVGFNSMNTAYPNPNYKRRSDKEYEKEPYLQDCAIFTYNPSSKAVKYLGTMMDASKAAGNLQAGEAIPKGHTKILNIGGKMYLASQSFHDFKQGIADLPRYRGSHLYSIEPASGKITDLSASLPDGVVTKNEGIIALNYIPPRNLIVGLTHPHSNLVFFNVKTNKIERNVTGIPWTLGNPLSREIVVSGDKVYLYRGVEEASARNQQYNVYLYNYATNKLTKTNNIISGGFWNGQATTSDGKKVYISTSCGELYVLDTTTDTTKWLTHMLPSYFTDNGIKLAYTYSLTMSPDQKNLYFIPTMFNDICVYEYDIFTNTVNAAGGTLSKGIYTGNGIRDKNNNYYWIQFGTNGNDWDGECKMVSFKITG